MDRFSIIAILSRVERGMVRARTCELPLLVWSLLFYFPHILRFTLSNTYYATTRAIIFFLFVDRRYWLLCRIEEIIFDSFFVYSIRSARPGAEFINYYSCLLWTSCVAFVLVRKNLLHILSVTFVLAGRRFYLSLL